MNDPVPFGVFGESRAEEEPQGFTMLAKLDLEGDCGLSDPATRVRRLCALAQSWKLVASVEVLDDALDRRWNRSPTGSRVRNEGGPTLEVSLALEPFSASLRLRARRSPTFSDSRGFLQATLNMPFMGARNSFLGGRARSQGHGGVDMLWPGRMNTWTHGLDDAGRRGCRGCWDAGCRDRALLPGWI